MIDPTDVYGLNFGMTFPPFLKMKKLNI